ncbi:hypothetical protein [Streptomyces sp. NPDC003247]|uniref:hypothetical protein n=1 Tax=Streptomyces sp. NPDC003247 TaxID=3364677 RepID=UPI00368321AD
MNARSAWLSPDGQTRGDTRVTQVGAVTPVTDAKGRSGVLPGSEGGQYRLTGLWLAGTAGSMSATMSVGRAVIQSTIARGAYPVAVTEPVTLTFADGNAQYGRIDLVVLRVYDHDHDGLGRYEAVVEIVQGEAKALPVAPDAPDASLPLFTVAVAAGLSAGTGGIAWDTARTDLRPTTVAVGGILPTRSDDTAAGGYPGAYREVADVLQRWNGSAWVPYPKAVGGIAPAGAVSTGAYTGQYRDSSTGTLQRWNGSVWAPAVTTPWFTSSLDAGSTTSTTYTAALVETTVTALTLNFTAPSTGAVLLHFGSRMSTASSSTATAYMAPQITQGSTVVFTANDEYAASYGGPVAGSVATMWRLYGLTPGTVYTMTALHRSSDAAVTCWFDNIFLRVDPVN